MAIKLIANYSKRLGLPGYSSHQFSVSIETELVTIDDVPQEAERIYRMLQDNVDEQIHQTGFVPPADYGMEPEQNHQPNHNGNGQTSGPVWRCSDKQKDLILKIVEENHLDKDEVDHLARQRFGKPVVQLNKVEASGLIDELLEQHGGNNGSHSSNGRRRNNAYAGVNGKGGRR